MYVYVNGFFSFCLAQQRVRETKKTYCDKRYKHGRRRRRRPRRRHVIPSSSRMQNACVCFSYFFFHISYSENVCWLLVSFDFVGFRFENLPKIRQFYICRAVVVSTISMRFHFSLLLFSSPFQFIFQKLKTKIPHKIVD